MKECTICKVNLSLENFSAHPTISDGHYNQCKKCRLAARNKRQLSKFKPIIDGTKCCLKCQQNLPKTNFLLNKSTKDGFNGWCKICSKDSSLKNKYSISLAEYNELLNFQDNKCAICKTPKPGGNSNILVVDHCHITGKVRGLLCNHCNTGLGKLGDSIESIKRALEYLETSSGKIDEGESLEK